MSTPEMIAAVVLTTVNDEADANYLEDALRSLGIAVWVVPAPPGLLRRLLGRGARYRIVVADAGAKVAKKFLAKRT